MVGQVAVHQPLPTVFYWEIKMIRESFQTAPAGKKLCVPEESGAKSKRL